MRYSMLVASIALSFYMLFVAGTTTPPSPLDFRKLNYQHLTSYGKKQVDCLTENIYFESAYEPRAGQIAVGMVTMNRVKRGFDSFMITTTWSLWMVAMAGSPSGTPIHHPILLHSHFQVTGNDWRWHARTDPFGSYASARDGFYPL